MSLFYNFAKLIRDSHHKKFKWWMWFLEIGLLSFIFFALTYGTFAKYQRDQAKEKVAKDQDKEIRKQSREAKTNMILKLLSIEALVLSIRRGDEARIRG